VSVLRFSSEGYFAIHVYGPNNIGQGQVSTYQCEIVRGKRARQTLGRGNEPGVLLPHGINFTLSELKSLVAEMERQPTCEHCGLTATQASACHPVIP
jgi:hypothetical protein